MSAIETPNVVLIVADDLGWSDLGSYGADLHETPNLDRLARDGVRFTQAYAPAPICSPTRAAIMTGQAPARLHMTIWYEGAKRAVTDRALIPPATRANLPHEEATLAEVLHDAGYHTAHVGKWHLGEAPYYPENQGFDVNIGGTLWGAPPTYVFPYRGPFGRDKEPRYVPGLAGGETGEYLTDRLTSEAIEILQKNGDRPVFLNLWYHTVHTPIEGKPELVDRYREKVSPELKHQNPAYAAMVHSLDENVGRVLDAIDALGIAERTLVIFTSDNGGFIGEHGEFGRVTNNAPLRSGKGSLYEGGIRVPLIVRAPGGGRGRTCEEPVILTDLFRTICEAAAPAHQVADDDGVSLLPLLNDATGSLSREALYFHYPHYYATTTPVSAIRAGDWKLLEYFEDDHVELYNLADDPSESRDLAAMETQVASNLRSQLHAWRQSVDAQLPTRNPAAPTEPAAR